MNSILVVLLAAIGWCSLARSNAQCRMRQQVLASKSTCDSQLSCSAANRVPTTNPTSALNVKKSLLLKGQKPIKDAVKCSSLVETGKIIDSLADGETSSLDILLRNNTGPLTLDELLADLLKDSSELNLPQGVQLSNKALVEALLSKNVLLNFPTTADNGIVIEDHRAVVAAFPTGCLRFPLTDKFGDILRNLSNALPDGAKEALGTLWGGNVVSDILESGALGLLPYPIKDALGIPVLDVGSLLFLVVQGGLKNLKFPMVNAFGLELRDDMDLLLVLVDGGFLKNLVYPVQDSKGLVLQSKLAFVKALREGLAFKDLKYPIKDSFGITIKRPDALMAALLDDDAAKALGFPLTDARTAVLKDKLQLFLTLLDGGLNLVSFPLRDAEGNRIKDKLAFLQAIVKALGDKQGLNVLLSRSVAAISKFSLTSNASTTSNNESEALVNALVNGQALSGLRFPLCDSAGNCIPNKETFLFDLLYNGLESMQLPLTNRDGQSFYSALDIGDALIDGSALMGLKFPLYDNRGKKIRDKEHLLQHIFQNDLSYPLAACASSQVQDFAELMSLLLDDDALDNLKFPLFDVAGGVFKNNADFLAALLKGAQKTLNFPLTEANGDVLKDLENLLQPALSNSTALSPPLEVNLNLTDISCNDTIWASLLCAASSLKFPFTEDSRRTLNNASDILEDLLKDSRELKTLRFPLSDKSGRVLVDKQELLDTLSDANDLSSLRFPLADCAGTVFKNKTDFLRRLLNGVNTSILPLSDSDCLNFSDGTSLLNVLLQAVLKLLTPVLQPLADVLVPLPSIINVFLSGDFTAIESLLTANSTNSSTALRFPLRDAAGRYISSELELFENLLNCGLNALNFPLSDGRGQVLNNKLNFLEQLVDNGPLAELQFPLSNEHCTVLPNEVVLLISVLNNHLNEQDFPLRDASGLTINCKLELLTKMLDSRALSDLNYPLADNNGVAINTKQALLERLVDGALAGYQFPIFDNGEGVFADKTAFAQVIDADAVPADLPDEQTAKPPDGAGDGLLKLLGDECSLSREQLALFRALKDSSLSDKDLRDLLGNEKFSVLKEKLTKADNANALDRRQLTKILNGILELLLRKRPELFRKLERNSDEYSFT